MKYIITESQRDKAVFKYLDNQDFEISKIGASTYFKHPDDDGFAQIKYGGRHHNEELYFIYKNADIYGKFQVYSRALICYIK